MAALWYSCRRIMTKTAYLESNITVSYVLCNRLFSYVAKEYSQDKDPKPIFFNKDVQNLLKSLTRVELSKVFRRRNIGEKKLKIPEYKFLTDDQLQAALASAKQKADVLLQIPPVVKVRKEINNVLSNDTALQGLDTSKYVFTDITFGIKNTDRLIVVRELDGSLRNADWSLRDRMNELYFPLHGRKLKMPLMFEDSYLKNLLSQNEYEFILDRACLQFEPDNEDYQRVTSITYQYINDNNDFEYLRSTRHFGAFTFFLAWFDTIDNLLMELIETFHINEANLLLKLYSKIHGVEFEITDLYQMDSIERYIKEFSHKRGPLELVLQTYKKLEMERRNLEHDIQKAHGLG